MYSILKLPYSFSVSPQFINPDFAKGTLPFILLGLTFMTTGTLWCLFWHMLHHLLRKH